MLIDASGLVPLIDAVIAFTAIEGLALAALHRACGRGVAPRDYALNLLSGLCLMLALRALAAEAAAGWVLAALLGAGVAHACDLKQRWRHGPRAADARALRGQPR